MKKIRDYLKSFLFSKDKPQPVFFWATLFCSLAVSMLVMRFLGHGGMSDMLIIGVLGFVAAWIALYNFQKNGGGQ